MQEHGSLAADAEVCSWSVEADSVRSRVISAEDSWCTTAHALQGVNLKP